MFTNEFELDASVTTVLDDSGAYEDLEMIVSDDYVCLRQWREHDWAEVIIISHKQWLELLAAYSLPEGAYHTRIA